MGEHSPLSGNLLLVAFEGWTDAGNAATDVLRFVKSQGAYTQAYSADIDRYLDYQFTRPNIRTDRHGKRKIDYPSVTLYREKEKQEPIREGRLHLLVGAEPARRWKQFTTKMLAEIQRLDISAIVFLGALLADAPHTRPIMVQAESANEDLRHRFDIERSTYEGPVGYLTVLAHEAGQAGIPSITIWASVPHYAHGTPSPKATSALITKIEQLTGAEIAHGELDLQAAMWESALNALAEDDADMRGYLEQLEQARDTQDLPSANGESIAAEIEKYLRRKNDGHGSDQGTFE